MPLITFIDIHGNERAIDAEAGQSLMQIACDHQIDGILADCGGSCSCGTCHVYLDESASARLKPPSQIEDDMLSCVNDRRKGSRLSCQVKASRELEGMIVRVADNRL